MNDGVPYISIPGILLSLLPLVVIGWIFLRWQQGVKLLAYATTRMVGQLLLMGYLLVYLFRTDSLWVGVSLLMAVVLLASWIALRPLRHHDVKNYLRIVLAMFLGGTGVLLLNLWIIQGDPFLFQPRIFIPLTGMIFANSMNTLSLAGERMDRELETPGSLLKARNTAFQAAMIPQINSFFAVGLVALPGMMTGQILAGVSPLIAVRYQILVMAMILGSAGLSAALYLEWRRRAVSGKPQEGTSEPGNSS